MPQAARTRLQRNHPQGVGRRCVSGARGDHLHRPSLFGVLPPVSELARLGCHAVRTTGRRDIDPVASEVASTERPSGVAPRSSSCTLRHGPCAKPRWRLQRRRCMRSRSLSGRERSLSWLITAEAEAPYRRALRARRFRTETTGSPPDLPVGVQRGQPWGPAIAASALHVETTCTAHQTLACNRPVSELARLGCHAVRTTGRRDIDPVTSGVASTERPSGVAPRSGSCTFHHGPCAKSCRRLQRGRCMRSRSLDGRKRSLSWPVAAGAETPTVAPQRPGAMETKRVPVGVSSHHSMHGRAGKRKRAGREGKEKGPRAASPPTLRVHMADSRGPRNPRVHECIWPTQQGRRKGARKEGKGIG